MRPISPALQSHLDSAATTLCTCWRVTRSDGVVLGFTDHDRLLTFDGDEFRPDTGADGSRLAATADLAVDNAEIAGALNSEMLDSRDLAAGRYDGARIDIWRVNWVDTDQRILLRSGVLGDVECEGRQFRVEIRGPSYELSRTVGRVYQRQCDAVVGDRRCGVDLTDTNYRRVGVVRSVLNAQRITVSGLGDTENGWFTDGVLRWTSGENQNGHEHIKIHQAAGDDAVIELWLPPGNTVTVGDGFVATVGCDRHAATCQEKFQNLINFRGFHFMPGNDVAIQYPVRTDQNDGGRR